MLLRLAVLILVLVSLGATAQAQDSDEKSFMAVWFSHSACADAPAGTPGATADTPINVDFEDPWYSSSQDDDTAKPNPDAAKYECRWVRLTGFMTWMNYYHYRATLHLSAGSFYIDDEVHYIVENFAPGSLPRSDLVRRKVSLVGRFYNLCEAAVRQQRESGESWGMVFGPCHYGHNKGMMLTDVRIEKIHDAAPQYFLGEINRPIMESLLATTGDESKEVEPVVKAWVTSSKKGLKPFADEYVAQYTGMSDEDIKDTYESIESPDSYESYLLLQPRFMKLDLQTAAIRIFRPAGSDTFEDAVGCICLEASCTDRWPLTEGDASRFLGDAACVALDRDKDGAWRW